MPHAHARPIAVFLILVGVCAAYAAGVFSITLSEGDATGTARTSPLIDTLLLLVPVVTCAAVQFRESRRRTVSGLRLWWQVAAVALGAPCAGFVLMLILIFNLYGKSP